MFVFMIMPAQLGEGIEAKYRASPQETLQVTYLSAGGVVIVITSPSASNGTVRLP
ncbi:hypothetical protein J2T16_003167 [Paenibacillus intestini]|nr:hypothetical protein [Paenibacillus intestini]